jgi:hypothetical protein
MNPGHSPGAVNTPRLNAMLATNIEETLSVSSLVYK